MWPAMSFLEDCIRQSTPLTILSSFHELPKPQLHILVFGSEKTRVEETLVSTGRWPQMH